MLSAAVEMREMCAGRRVSGAGAPRDAHKVHPGLSFPCHHVCPSCASPWSTVGSLKPHHPGVVRHRNSNCGRIYSGSLSRTGPLSLVVDCTPVYTATCCDHETTSTRTCHVHIRHSLGANPMRAIAHRNRLPATAPQHVSPVISGEVCTSPQYACASTCGLH